MKELLQIMRRLRDPQAGCPWDLAQDFRSIAPHTLEEAHEVVDAIDRGDREALRDELGDLLFQVVFHSQMAAERGWFGFDDVAAGISDKLTRRHPHVFGDASAAAGSPADSAAQVAGSWDAIKAAERTAAGDAGALAGVALSLPALARASKLGKRASRVGFDWQDATGVREKVIEELGEFDAALAGESPERQLDELGDLLFAISNWARHRGLDPEEALRRCNLRFESRFRAMERMALEQQADLAGLSAGQWEALWAAAKRQEGP